jgi:hypothetical protein
MRKTTIRACISLLLSLIVSLQTLAITQTATATTISGFVTDAQGAVIQGATVTLRDKATNQERLTTTNHEGRYVFANIDPGLYDLTVVTSSFKKATITDIKAEVSKPVTQDIKLEAGGVTEEVTVSAGAEAQLQKQDSSIGNVFDGDTARLFPNLNRQANQLLALQPGATPTGAVFGSRTDQSTYALDGIDVSDNVIGQEFRTVVPSPIEAIEEFRVTVANPTASFGRSSGAQVVLLTRRGANQFHGSLYEYHQNDNLNSNSWSNNRVGLPRPVLIDNRFGGTVSGPIFKEKTFFFFLYEGRRNRSAATVTRIVPTESFKAGQLRFRDATGAVRNIDPETLDPLGLGANPTILEMLNLYPAANDFTVGDGLNTAGFTANLSTSLRGDQGIFRLDHQFTSNWTFDGSFNAYRQLQVGTGQVDIVNRRGTADTPSRPRSLSAGLTGLLSSRVTNEFRFGWVHDRLAFDRISPFPQVSAVNVGLDLAAALLDEPIDVDTQRARKQARTINVYQFIDNLTWSKDTHTMQFGANIRHINSFDFRDDKVVGSITTPVAQIGSVSFNRVPATERPAFIQPADVARYNQLYASLLGQVENITYLATRNGQLQPNPIGTGLIADSKLNAYEFYAADTWRVTPSLTLSYGLMYQWQVPPIEKEGRQTIVTFADTGELVDPVKYLADKRAAAEQGRIFNPDLAYVPINESGRKYAFDTDRKNFSPRVAAAWSPSYQGGLLGALFGDRKTVLRGGYSLLYDRINTVQTIIIPTLGVGFGQTIQTGTTRNSRGDIFRVGIDGQLPVPLLGPATVPIIPAKPFSEVLSFVVDPFISVPKNHTVDFTVQREIPGGMIVEAGFVGRYGRNLYQSINLNQMPYMFKDPTSGQTFAQAFDALADQLRAGVLPTAVSSQPWFENLLPNLAPLNGSRTQRLASVQTGNIINGNLSNFWLTFLDLAAAAQPFNNIQSIELFYRTSLGRSNYNGVFATVRKRFSSGLTFDANYTVSRSLDQIGAVQNSANLLPNSFDPDAEYGPSPNDVTHLFNTSTLWELPFGTGRRFGDTSNPVFSRLLSGWYVSGIYRAQSGFPLTIAQGAQVWGGSALLGFASGAIGLGGADFGTGVTKNVKGSGNIGISGDPANRGSGLNIFGDPEAVFKAVRRVRLSEDTRSGRGALRGLGLWQLDLSVGKATSITETVKLRFSVDFLNALNKVNYNDPTVNLQSPANFGVISSQVNSEFLGIFPRRIQLGGRIEF